MRRFISIALLLGALSGLLFGSVGCGGDSVTSEPDSGPPPLEDLDPVESTRLTK